VQSLKKAIERGYSNAEQLRMDEDLDGLRGREDFRKMMGEFQRKTAVKQK
jgi:hypothetical protein